MSTKIFATRAAFDARSDRAINGVSPDFAAANDGWDAERGNRGCWNCSDCSGCVDCSDCSDCFGCVDCSGKRGVSTAESGGFVVPVVPNIHQTVYQAASQPDALDMGNWHTCETTHCRAGWAVHLAGDAGEALERQTSPLFAAMQIYKASSPIRVSPVRFFESNEVALADMARCASAEASQ